MGRPSPGELWKGAPLMQPIHPKVLACTLTEPQSPPPPWQPQSSGCRTSDSDGGSWRCRWGGGMPINGAGGGGGGIAVHQTGPLPAMRA